MTDRGKGFFQATTGEITNEYDAALQAHGFRALMEDLEVVQPGNLQDLTLYREVNSQI